MYSKSTAVVIQSFTDDRKGYAHPATEKIKWLPTCFSTSLLLKLDASLKISLLLMRTEKLEFERMTLTFLLTELFELNNMDITLFSFNSVIGKHSSMFHIYCSTLVVSNDTRKSRIYNNIYLSNDKDQVGHSVFLLIIYHVMDRPKKNSSWIKIKLKIHE